MNQNSSYALFRLPDSRRMMRVVSHGQPRRLESVEEVGREAGFVVAPFMATEDEPVVLIEPDELTEEPMPADEPVGMSLRCVDSEGERRAYASDFERFHEELTAGRFVKIVLARRSERRIAQPLDAERLFIHACHCYPHQMVALIHTPLTGTWLVATPEVLLRREGDAWATMALAGTMTTDGPWSLKNREEQALVADYIEKKLTGVVTELTRSATYTRTAARLFHLCTDFRFHIDDARVGALLHQLHPTPAVCGLPKEEARRFIVANEYRRRSYYSGFMGPMHLDGLSALYVSLRCARLSADRLTLFAGGGLLPESEEEREWAETEAKLKTISHVFE